MSEELGPRALERLKALGRPLVERPEDGAVDLERYELGPELGRGGMGVVRVAWDKELGRRVALKLLARPAGLSAEARARFVREARAAARLSHPSIAKVYDATPDAIAMQLVAGETLATRDGSDVRELVGLLRDAALAIHYAHGEGVVHRDLKPANLMVEEGERPHVFVMDFGLAKESRVDGGSLTGAVVGTPAFMAPEQAAGRAAEVGPRTDVYGLGACLYACLAGRAPFRDDDVYGLLRRVVEEEPEPLRRLAPRVDRDLETIVAKAMQKEPARRYPTALALASDLDRWLRGEPVQARPPSLAYRLQRFVSRRQGALAAAGVAGLVVLLAALPFVLQARARRSAAEERIALTERVLAFSQRVNDALYEARTTRISGIGHERTAHSILSEAVDECHAFLLDPEVAEVGRVWFFAGRLLAEQERDEEALEAFDQAERLDAGIGELPRERGLVLAAMYRKRLPLLGGEPPAELDELRQRGAADLRAALADEPEALSPERLFAEGQLAWLGGDLDTAVARLREVVEMDAVHRRAHLSLCTLYLLRGEDALAMRHSVVATDLMRGYRPAYVALLAADRAAAVARSYELLPLEGMEELLVDFRPLLHTEPDDAHVYGMRAQVQVRLGLRARERDASAEARACFEQAVAELGGTLLLREGYAPALVDRGACRVQLAFLRSTAGETAAAAAELAAARADYDAALALEPRLAVAWYDRALLHLARARLARLAQLPQEAARELQRARADAAEALRLGRDEHPLRGRFEALLGELE